MEESFTVEKHELKALAAFVSKSWDRSRLTSLYFYEDGALAASDGHTLVVREHRKTPQTKRPERQKVFGVPKDSLARLIGALGPKQAVRIGPLADEGWGEFEIYDPAPGWDGPGVPVMKGHVILNTESEPPSFFKVVPELESGVPAAGKVGFNLDYLRKVDLIRIACGHRAGRGVEMYPPREELAPAVFRVEAYGSDFHWLAVIMPLRI